MKKEEREKLEHMLSAEGVSAGKALESYGQLLNDGMFKEKSRKKFHCSIKDVPAVLIKYKKYQNVPNMDRVECELKEQCETCPYEDKLKK